MPVTRSRKKADAQPAEPTYYVISDDDDVLGQPGPAVEEQVPDCADQAEEPDQQPEVDYERLTKRQAIAMLQEAHQKMASVKAGILESVEQLKKIRDDLNKDRERGIYSRPAVEQAQAATKEVEASLTEVVKPAQDE